MSNAVTKHGITANTPKNIPFGAGAWFKNLMWDSSAKAWNGDCIGATSGGGKLSIEGEYIDIELDGALVLVKGLTVKQGGKAAMDVNMAELTGDNIKMATNFKKAEQSDADGFDLYTDKGGLIDEGEYLENFGYVGETLGKKKIIVIFEAALCKSAFEFEPKGKENTILKATLEAYAENDSDLETLPVKIYYPSDSAE